MVFTSLFSGRFNDLIFDLEMSMEYILLSDLLCTLKLIDNNYQASTPHFTPLMPLFAWTLLSFTFIVSMRAWQSRSDLHLLHEVNCWSLTDGRRVPV
jgi:hypothetical protein